MKVERIWWRQITPHDLVAVQRGILGSSRNKRTLDISDYRVLLEFFGRDSAMPADQWPELALGAFAMGGSEKRIGLTFRPNRRQLRFEVELAGEAPHPGWNLPFIRSERDRPQTVEAAYSLLQSVGGAHIYLVRSTKGEYFTGVTEGHVLPRSWPEVCRPLFDGESSGYIELDGGEATDLTPLALEILKSLGRRRNVLVYGPPATGKTHAVAQVRRLLDRTATKSVGVELHPEDRQRPFVTASDEAPMATPVMTDWVTFHQDYGYEDFIIGLRPTGDGIRLAPYSGRLLDLAMRLHQAGTGSAMLVVDEINRGNVARILGDFMTYMDPAYRQGESGPSDTAVPVSLPKVQRSHSGDAATEPIWMLSGEPASLPVPWYFPRNMYLLATMNSVDRAVAPLDSAIGRRFDRIDAYPDPDQLAQHFGLDDETLSSEGSEVTDWTAPIAALSLMIYLNEEISERLGPDSELGQLYFWNAYDWDDLQRIWDRDVWPQIRDRFGSRPDQLADILRVGQPGAPRKYPFRFKRRTGRAIDIGSMMALSAEEAAETFRFLTSP